LLFWICILVELDTQRKSLLEKGEEVPSYMVKLMLEELMAGRVEPSPGEMPKEKEKYISALMVEFLAPKVQGAKGWEADMCMLPLQQTNFMASDETMTSLALENMWQQWHGCCTRNCGDNGKRKIHMTGYQPEGNGMVTGRY
jgi:hypothetical protein